MFYGRLASVCSALGCAVLFGVLNDWLDQSSDECDYPQQCLFEWFPRVFAILDLLWVAVLAAATYALWAILRNGTSWVARAIMCAGWVTLLGCALLMPRPGLFGLGDAQQMGEPWFDGTYRTLSVALTAGAAALVIGALLSPGGEGGQRRSSSRAVSTARSDEL